MLDCSINQSVDLSMPLNVTSLWRPLATSRHNQIARFWGHDQNLSLEISVLWRLQGRLFQVACSGHGNSRSYFLGPYTWYNQVSFGSRTEHGASSNSVDLNTGMFEIYCTRLTEHAIERHQRDLVFDSLQYRQTVQFIAKDWSDVLRSSGHRWWAAQLHVEGSNSTGSSSVQSSVTVVNKAVNEGMHQCTHVIVSERPSDGSKLR